MQLTTIHLDKTVTTVYVWQNFKGETIVVFVIVYSTGNVSHESMAVLFCNIGIQHATVKVFP